MVNWQCIAISWLLRLRSSRAGEFLCETDYDCVPHGVCNLQRLTCDCNDGWYGDRCDRDCKINCQNGSQCIEEDVHGLDFENEWSCKCQEGYSGGLCQIKDNALLQDLSKTQQHVPRYTAAAVTAAMSLVVLLTAATVWTQRKRRLKLNASKEETTSNPEVELPNVT